MHVVYCMTRNLYDDFRKTVKSLYKTNDDITLHVICEDDAIDGIEADFIKIDPRRYFSLQNYRFTLFSCARLLAPTLIDADRVIYLDVDTIVCDSLLPLWELDLDGYYFAAVPEYGNYNPFFRPLYFNAGVMVMNLKLMREDGIADKLIEAINKGRYRYGEQDAINHLCYSKVKPLPTRYNVSLCTGIDSEPAIVHFAGIYHWQKGDIPFHEYRDLYFPPPQL